MLRTAPLSILSLREISLPKAWLLLPRGPPTQARANWFRGPSGSIKPVFTSASFLPAWIHPPDKSTALFIFWFSGPHHLAKGMTHV